MLFFSTLASLLKSRNAVMRNDVFTDVVKLYFNRGKIIDHRAKCIAPLSLRVGQRYKHFGTSPWAAWAGERSLVPDPRQTSPRLVLNLPARGETRVLRVAKFCSIKLLYGDLYFVYVFGHLFKLKWNFQKLEKKYLIAWWLPDVWFCFRAGYAEFEPIVGRWGCSGYNDTSLCNYNSLNSITWRNLNWHSLPQTPPRVVWSFGIVLLLYVDVIFVTLKFYYETNLVPICPFFLLYLHISICPGVHWKLMMWLVSIYLHISKKFVLQDRRNILCAQSSFYFLFVASNLVLNNHL